MSVIELQSLGKRTVNSQVSECSTGCPLNLDVRALEEEEYWLEGIAVDLSDIYHKLVSQQRKPLPAAIAYLVR